jgi:type I restriction enzyme S subunit
VVFPDLLIEMHMDPMKVHAEYLQLVWDSREVRADIESRARTASGIHKINLANLAQVAVPLPPLETQRRIASDLRARLDVIDTAVAAIDEEVAAIGALPAALLRRVFDGLAA